MLKSLGRRLARDARGSGAVEMALIAPMVLVLSLGAIEAVRLTLTTNKVNRVAAGTADMVTRHQVLKDGVTATADDTIGAYFAAANSVADPLDLEGAGRVYISGLTNTDGRGARVAWQRTHPDYELDVESRVGAQGSFADLPGEMTVAWGETTVVTEVFFEFQPLVWFGDAGGVTFHREAFFRPRLGGLASLQTP